MEDDFFLTNLELRESTETGDVASGLSHASMKGMVLLTVLELAARGEPRGAVTVLHDAGDTGERYRELATHLAENGWAVALPDLRGHGRTEGERGHSNGLKEVWRDVQEIQDHLAYRMPDAPKVLVGVGLGALYAVSYALEHPGTLAAVVLVGPLHEPAFHEPEKPKGLGKFFKKVLPTSPGRVGWNADQLCSDPAQAAAWTGSELTHDTITLRAIEEARRAAREHLPRVAAAGVPVLVLHGSDDPLSPVAASRALAADGVTVEILAGQRHHVLQDVGRSDTFRRLAAWLDANARG